MRKTTVGILLLLHVLFWGCDCTYFYEYEMQNDTDSVITVEYRRPNEANVVEIPSGERVLLFRTDHGIESCNGPQYEDVNVEFVSIEVIKDNLFKSERNYSESRYWEYNNSSYLAIVTDDEFE